MFNSFKWEIIDQYSCPLGSSSVKRSPVPGGWLIESFHFEARTRIPTNSLIFIRDRRHKWLKNRSESVLLRTVKKIHALFKNHHPLRRSYE